MAETAEPDHADPTARADVPGAQRRVGGDAGADQRRGLRQVQPVGDAQHELLAHDKALGVAAIGRLAGDPIAIIVGLRVALAAELLQALAALIALLAGIDHAADRDRVADLVAGDFVADLGHAADDLVAGNHRVDAPSPIVAGLVEVGVADAAVEHLHDDIVGAWGPSLKRERRQRRVGGSGCITKGFQIFGSIIAC